MAMKFDIYPGRDNVEDLIIGEGETILTDLSAILRVQVIFGGSTYDSDTVPADTIWWTDSKTVTQTMADDDDRLSSLVGTSIHVLKLRLGGETLPAAGTYENACLVLFDGANPDGTVWDRKGKITVLEACT